MELWLEMKVTSPSGVNRNCLPIDRPEGFDDESYLQHAKCAAMLLQEVMNGYIDHRHRASDGATTTMVIVEEDLPKDVIEDLFKA